MTLRKTHYPSKNTIFLPPLSKGGGLTARHKLLLCCFLLAICPLFLYCKLFCRQDGGIALHHRPFQNRTIPRKRGGSVARSSRANYGGDCSCLEVVSLIPLVLFLFHIDRCTHSNSEPEKCCPTNSTIGSLLSQPELNDIAEAHQAKTFSTNYGTFRSFCRMCRFLPQTL